MVANALFGPDITVIILLIAAAAVLARVLSLAAPLLFLATGIIAGPVLGIVKGGHAAEVLVDFGLVFLLFLIGIELKANRLQPIIQTIIRISPWQILVTFLVFFGLTLPIFGLTPALVIGIAMTYSSTAVVLRMLSDRNEIDTVTGRLATGLLLFEDMTVIVVIAAITTGGAAASLVGAFTQTVFALLVIGGTAYLCSRFVLPRLMTPYYDRPHQYFLKAVGWLFLFLGLSTVTGVSHEIGAFFAGIALAQLPGNDELHERVRPLTDLFMALFFISLSVGLTLTDLLTHWELAVLLSLAVLVDKFLVHLGLFRIAGYDRETSFRGAVNMMQTSEFSLVLGATAVTAGMIGSDILGLLTVVALTTMMVSTVLIDRQDALYRLIGTPTQRTHRATDAVLVGFGEYGPDVLTSVMDRFDDIVVVDPDPDTAAFMEHTAHEHVFADIRHEEIKRESGFYTAQVVIGIDVDPETGEDMLAARDGPTIMVTDDTATGNAFKDAGATTVLDRDDLGSKRLRDVVTRITGGGDG